MEFLTYQKLAHRTSKDLEVGGNSWIYPALGLASESGELCGKLKKILRDYDGIVSAERQLEIAAELGDVLWYVSELATQMGLDLSAVAFANIKKLEDRQRRGVIGGNGDNR